MIDEQVRQMVNEFAQNMQYQGISLRAVLSDYRHDSGEDSGGDSPTGC